MMNVIDEEGEEPERRSDPARNGESRRRRFGNCLMPSAERGAGASFRPVRLRAACLGATARLRHTRCGPRSAGQPWKRNKAAAGRQHDDGRSNASPWSQTAVTIKHERLKKPFDAPAR
jgi:hypothetical protein